jgi:hypothetical protein
MLGLAPEPYFFPPPGRGTNAFGSYVSPQFAAQTALQMDAMDLERDEASIKMEENAMQRLTNQSKRRALPFLEAADIAKAKLAARQAELDEENSPFLAGERREQALTNIEQDQATRRQLPGTEELGAMEREARIEELRSADPHEKELARLTKGNPAALAAYGSFLRSAPTQMAGDKAKRHAFNSALSYLRDQEAVAAIDALDATEKSTRLRDELLDDVSDSLTGEYLGSVVRKGVDPKKVAEAVKSARNVKRLDAYKEKEIAQQHKAVDHLNDVVGDLARQITAFEKSPAGLAGEEPPSEIQEARAERAKLIRQRGLLLKKMGILPDDDDKTPAATPASGKTEKAKSYLDEARRISLGE